MRDRRSNSSKFPLLAIVAVLVATPFALCCGGCLVFSNSVASAVRKKEAAAKKELAEGNRLWDAGQKTAAVTAYKSVLTMNVRNVPSQTECSTVYQRVIDTDIEQGDVPNARQMIQTALSNNIELRKGDDASGRLLESVRAAIEKQRSIEQAQQAAKQEQRAADDKLAKDKRDVESKQRDEARAEQAKKDEVTQARRDAVRAEKATKDEETRAKREAEATPDKGHVGYMWTGSQSFVWVTISETAMDELDSFRKADNQDAIQQMVDQGRLLQCDRNTKVTVVDTAIFSSRVSVRMMDGKYVGRKGIIEGDRVHKIAK